MLFHAFNAVVKLEFDFLSRHLKKSQIRVAPDKRWLHKYVTFNKRQLLLKTSKMCEGDKTIAGDDSVYRSRCDDVGARYFWSKTWWDRVVVE